MRFFLKFLHTLGAAGLMGAMAALLLLSITAAPPASLIAYSATRQAMAAISTWIFMPSLGLTLIAGLLAIGFNRAFHNAGWAWIKAASGILLFESGFVGVAGPMQQEAALSAKLLVAQGDVSRLGASLHAEQTTLWVLLGVATFNVAFGIWRPRLQRRSLPE